MSREEVERIVGVTPRRFRRGPFATNDEDIFEPLGMSVGYDERDRCDSIEVGSGQGIDLEYGGYHLFAHPAREVREWARAQDPSLDPKDGFRSNVLGLSMWAEWIDEVDLMPGEEQEPGQSFLVFRPGYYEEHAKHI